MHHRLDGRERLTGRRLVDGDHTAAGEGLQLGGGGRETRARASGGDLDLPRVIERSIQECDGRRAVADRCKATKGEAGIIAPLAPTSTGRSSATVRKIIVLPICATSQPRAAADLDAVRLLSAISRTVSARLAARGSARICSTLRLGPRSPPSLFLVYHGNAAQAGCGTAAGAVRSAEAAAARSPTKPLTIFPRDLDRGGRPDRPGRPSHRVASPRRRLSARRWRH